MIQPSDEDSPPGCAAPEPDVELGADCSSYNGELVCTSPAIQVETGNCAANPCDDSDFGAAGTNCCMVPPSGPACSTFDTGVCTAPAIQVESGNCATDPCTQAADFGAAGTNCCMSDSASKCEDYEIKLNGSGAVSEYINGSGAVSEYINGSGAVSEFIYSMMNNNNNKKIECLGIIPIIGGITMVVLIFIVIFIMISIVKSIVKSIIIKNTK